MEFDFQIMQWESEFFGFEVARIETPRLSEDGLRSCLQRLRQMGVRMAGWPADESDSASHAAAETLGGFLADRKVTYSKQIPESTALEPVLPEGVFQFEGSEATPRLIDLALQSAEFSRFRVDSRFSDERCDAMYRLWMERSVRRELADEVLIIPDTTGEPLAFAALAAQDNRGQIVLIGVDRGHRGQGLGSRLMAAADQCFRSWGVSDACVVTQKANRSSCGLYEHCGYREESCVFFYHFWLDEI